MEEDLTEFVVNIFKKGYYPPVMVGDQRKYVAGICWINGGYRAKITSSPDDDLNEAEWYPELYSRGADGIYTDDIGEPLFNNSKSDMEKVIKGESVLKFGVNYKEE